jgi:hypothetical protein
LLREAILEKSQDDARRILQEFVAIAVYAPGQRYPVPDAIVAELVNRASEEELFNVLDQIVCEWFSHGGAYSGPNWKRRGTLLFRKLPRGLRLAHNLMSLESEIDNGGFVQFFGNSNGQYARETLDDCRLVGAVRKADLLRRAMKLKEAVWEAMDRSCEISEADPFTLDDNRKNDPEFQMDELDSAYFALEDAEPMHRLVAAYLRAHPQKCTTSRPGRIVRKPRKRK